MSDDIERSARYARRGGGKPDYIFANGEDLNAMTKSNRFNPNKVYEYKNGILAIVGERK